MHHGLALLILLKGKTGTVTLSADVKGEKVKMKIKVGPAVKLKMAGIQDKYINTGWDEDEYALKMKVKNNGTAPVMVLEKVLYGMDTNGVNWGIDF